MPIFCHKTLEPAVRLSERFKIAREKLKLDINTLSARTRIPKKYLIAIEESRFDALPEANAYRTAYMREYASALNLNPAGILYQFSKESEPETQKIFSPRHQPSIWSQSLTYLLRNALLALFVIGFLTYLAFEVRGVLLPPKLALYSPAEGYISSASTVVIQGQTEKEVKLTVNGQEIMANDQGKFEANIDLQKGVNTITMVATKKHGKTTTVTRHVVVKEGVERVSVK